MNKTLILIITMLCASINTQAQYKESKYAKPQDSLKLVEIFNNTNGQNWYNKSGWLSGNVKNWFGINNQSYYYCVSDSPYYCPFHFDIISIHLSGNNLSGQLPKGIANTIGLSNMDIIDLSHNHLYDSLPSSWGNGDGLSEIDLSHNNLFGSIPSSWGNEATDFIDLSYNQLSGNIPLDLFISKENAWLDLSHNQLTGGIPEDITIMEEIEHLDLSHNKLTGPVPQGINRLKDNYEPLESLDISHNRFNFDGMELLAQELGFAIYAPQDFIPINYRNCTLSVSAGGILANNAYTWYRDGIWEATKIGDSTYSPFVPGNYRVVIANSKAPALILYSKEIPLNTATWVATGNNSWENVTNWLCGIIPDSTTEVIIGNGAVVVLNSTTSIGSLNINPGANFTASPGAVLKINGSGVGAPISTILRINIKDGRSWSVGDTMLKPADQTTVKLYHTLAAVANNNPAYTLITNDSGFIEVPVPFANSYYLTAQKDTLSNIHNSYLVKGIFLTQAEVNMSPVQNPAGVVGGVKLTDINNDGIINGQDAIIADTVLPIYKSKTIKTVVVY